VSERYERILIFIASLIGGGVVGLLGAVAQQGVLYIGTFPLPWGITLALALVVAYLIGLRLVVDSRWPSALGLIGILAVTLILLGETAGGSILIPANLWGTIWSAAPGVIGAIVVAWPRLRRRAVSAAK
jgi:N-acetyl-1-D-myo-inositol-2-amino-2-deoxy-alpha-D-glucopyranoside deacetylase